MYKQCHKLLLLNYLICKELDVFYPFLLTVFLLMYLNNVISCTHCYLTSQFSVDLIQYSVSVSVHQL